MTGASVNHSHVGSTPPARPIAPSPPTAPALERLGGEAVVETVVGASAPDPNGLDVTIGLRCIDLAPAGLELRPGTSVIVAGPPGSGKTTALRTLAAAALLAEPSCRVVAVSDEPDAWPGTVRTLPTDPGPTLVLVDGLASVTEAMVRDFDAATYRDQLWVAIADQMDRLQAGPWWLGQNLAGKTGLFLAPEPEDGKLFGISLPEPIPTEFQPGRGFLVRAGNPELVQIVKT